MKLQTTPLTLVLGVLLVLFVAQTESTVCLLYIGQCRNLCSTVYYSPSSYCTVTGYFFIWPIWTVRCQCSLYGTPTKTSTSTSTSTAPSKSISQDLKAINTLANLKIVKRDTRQLDTIQLPPSSNGDIAMEFVIFDPHPDTDAIWEVNKTVNTIQANAGFDLQAIVAQCKDSISQLSDASSTTIPATSTITSSTQTTTRAIPITDGLINYWSFNGNMYDSISKLTMNGSFSYVNDRNDRANSAIDYNGGYSFIPKCANANTIQTIALWIYVTNGDGNHNLIDLNNDFYTLSIVNGQIRFWVDGQLYVTSSYGTNVWTHIATTLNGTMHYLYKNGEVTWSGPHALAVNYGNVCSFGWYKSGWNLYAYLDDVFFFNRALNESEVITIMNSNV